MCACLSVKERGRDRDREREGEKRGRKGERGERALPSAVSLSECHRLKSELEKPSRSPIWVPGSQVLGHHQLPFQVHWQAAAAGTGAPLWDVRLPC